MVIGIYLDLNTSNVTVNLSHIDTLYYSVFYLNTSNVTVNPCLIYNLHILLLNLNTSNVTVNH